MAQLNPYLNFKGSTEEAFNFYKSVFGGEFSSLIRFGEHPGCDGMPAEDKNKIMHMSLPIGRNILMGTDVGDSAPFLLREGNNISLTLSPGSRQEADQLFDSLSEGGDVLVPIADSSWGSYFGMVTDRFGIPWMIDYDLRNEN